MQVWYLASLNGLRIWHCQDYGIGYRCVLDPALLWLLCRPVAAAPIRLLAWEPPYAAGAALKSKSKKKKKKKRTLVEQIKYKLCVIKTIISVLNFKKNKLVWNRYLSVSQYCTSWESRDSSITNHKGNIIIEYLMPNKFYISF